MFVDASALCAVLLREPEATAMVKAMELAKGKLIITPIVRIEATLAVARAFKEAEGAPDTTEAHFEKASTVLRGLLEALDVREMHVTESMGTAALEALAKYGRGTGHPAKLNFGDALSYAGAKAFHLPLLYKGNDFAHTDLA